jgi:putative transposase
LARGTRSERALKLALAEMYAQGVSTRKVKAMTEQLCGFEITSSQVSRATAEFDEHFKQWRERDLGQMAYVQVDAAMRRCVKAAWSLMRRYYKPSALTLKAAAMSWV